MAARVVESIQEQVEQTVEGAPASKRIGRKASGRGGVVNALEFRFYYFTSRYDETVAFYRDSLGLEIFRSWLRDEQDRGTIFRSPNGAGYIEIESGDHSTSIRGGFYIEVEDVDGWYELVRKSGAPILQELTVTTYGHRNFKTADPNGVEVSFFQYLSANTDLEG